MFVVYEKDLLKWGDIVFSILLPWCKKISLLQKIFVFSEIVLTKVDKCHDTSVGNCSRADQCSRSHLGQIKVMPGHIRTISAKHAAGALVHCCTIFHLRSEL